MKTITNPTTAARYERRNTLRRKVHLANGNALPACGAQSNKLPLVSAGRASEVTCETCRDLAAKGGGL